MVNDRVERRQEAIDRVAALVKARRHLIIEACCIVDLLAPPDDDLVYAIRLAAKKVKERRHCVEAEE